MLSFFGSSLLLRLVNGDAVIQVDAEIFVAGAAALSIRVEVIN